jgi:hypothetical protein
MERESDVQKGEMGKKKMEERRKWGKCSEVVLAARKKKKNEGERESLFNKLKE